MLRGRMPNTSIVTCLSCGGPARTRRRKRSSSSASYAPGRMHVIFYHASGINGQNVFVHLPSRTVVAKFSTWPCALSQRMLATTVDGVLATCAALQGGPGEGPGSGGGRSQVAGR